MAHQLRIDSVMLRRKCSVVLAVIVGGLPSLAPAAELRPDTIEAWDKYLCATETAMHARLNAGKSFLWTDELKERKEQVRAGEIVIAPVVGDGTQSVPGGIIHHWIGAVFIPSARLPTLQAILDDHDGYKTIYKPAVVDSRSLGSNAGEQEFSMVWIRHVLFVNAAMRGRYRTREFAVDERHGYSVADTTRIEQIENYGKRSQRFLPPDSGSGFIWRIHTIVRYAERDSGVYLEIEALALSRDIPSSLRRMITPIVNHLSIDSLKTTLRQTRQAVQTRLAT